MGGPGRTPFRPVTEALAAWLRADGLPDAPELRPFRPLLARLVPHWRDERGVVDASPVLLAEAVVRLLRVVAAQRGCLILFDARRRVSGTWMHENCPA